MRGRRAGGRREGARARLLLERRDSRSQNRDVIRSGIAYRLAGPAVIWAAISRRLPDGATRGTASR